jgi:hypothetical protein
VKIGALTFVLGVAFGPAQAPPAPGAVPIVLELFTSEGCSSCPPADALLRRLANEQSVSGVQIIPLEMHVTYWDRLGWKDPASLDAATARQQDYSRVFGADRVYTPQAVVDGADEVVGSDESAIRRAIAKAVRRPHKTIEVTAALMPDGVHATTTLHDVHDDMGQERLRVVLVITEDGVTSVVTRGENGGRTLRHDAVVRRVVLDGQALGAIPPEWRRDRLRLTAFAQGERTRRIYASATVHLK